jgi:mRNA-degrading endonuclease RelE of RelBE toxin-antitoxin system
MPNDENPQVEVRFSKQFKRDLKQLVKRYRRIKSDLNPVLEQLQSGETLGDRIQGTQHLVYKVRIRNTDARKGKSGGYRVIYYIQVVERIILITIYSKSEQSDISSEEIVNIIQEVENETEE